MGVAFKDLIHGKEISLEDLSGKILVVDTYNLLYQFLSSIRARDGQLLIDSKGNVTSHLVGIFSRITNFMSLGIKLAFVFDGKAPDLKQKEREKRREAKVEAQKEYEKAKEKEDVDLMKKYASRTSVLNAQMIDDAKKLISYLGLPIIQAPSEGEAQASYIVTKEKCFGVVSQDYDSLLYGTQNLIRNLSIAGKRKVADKLSYTKINPEIISISDALNELGIDQDQLIAMAILIGTDYNQGGIKGIGPKNALKLVKEHKKNFDKLFEDVKWNDYFDFDWKEVFNLFKKMPVTDNYKLEWTNINKEKIKKFLLEHDFSEERINSTLEKIEKSQDIKKQKSLFEF